MRSFTTVSIEPNLDRLVENYDVFCLDVWGVLQDGIRALPGAIETVRELKRRNKKVALISNTPSRSIDLRSELVRVGYHGEQFDVIATAGEVAYHAIVQGLTDLTGYSASTRQYFYVGPEERRGLLEGSGLIESRYLRKADFILLCGFNDDQRQVALYRQVLEDCKALGLPMLCCSPDQFIIQNATQRVDCAGMLAREFQDLGGEVIYFGKPYLPIYEYVRSHFSEKEKLISIGDTLETDVLGANRSSIDSALLFSGVVGHLIGNRDFVALKDYMASLDVFPDYIIEDFSFFANKRHRATQQL